MDKVDKQAMAMIHHGYSWQQIRHRLTVFKKIDQRIGKWDWVRFQVIKTLRKNISAQ